MNSIWAFINYITLKDFLRSWTVLWHLNINTIWIWKTMYRVLNNWEKVSKIWIFWNFWLRACCSMAYCKRHHGNSVLCTWAVKTYFYLLLLGRFSAVQKALWESLPWIRSAKRMHKFITAAKQDLILEFLYITENTSFKTVVLCFFYNEG